MAVYVHTTKTGSKLSGMYKGGGLQAAKKARTKIGGKKKMKIFLRKTGQDRIREYSMGRKLLKKDERGPFGQKYKTFGRYVATH
tara:strand:- start:197 stop:448 length:252 start_codon:yes stop_codon:yes gene_type:complete